VYHGQARWTVPTDFAALFGAPGEVPEPLRRFLPSFAYHLLDVSPNRPPAEAGAEDLRVVLRVLREIGSERLGPDFDQVLGALDAHSEIDPELLALLDMVMSYVLIARPDVPATDLEAGAERVFKEKGDAVMTSVYETWVEKGIREGMEKGMEKGRVEGILVAIQSVLATRFGAVPAEVQAALRDRPIEQLQALLPIASVCGSIDEFPAAI
jgi:hypothetical protein